MTRMIPLFTKQMARSFPISIDPPSLMGPRTSSVGSTMSVVLGSKKNTLHCLFSSSKNDVVLPRPPQEKLDFNPTVCAKIVSRRHRFSETERFNSGTAWKSMWRFAKVPSIRWRRWRRTRPWIRTRTIAPEVYREERQNKTCFGKSDKESLCVWYLLSN